jgi:anti-repressor protein
MESLVIKSKKGNPVTTSLIVSEVFEKYHKDVLESIRDIMRSAENSAHFYATGFYQDSMNRTQELFYMNRDGFSILVMGFTGEKALKFKIAFIEAFNEMEKRMHDSKYIIPQTFAEALELAAKQTRELESKERIISLQAPKVEFADKITNTENLVDIGQAAKLLKLPFGRNTFFKRLRDDGIFFRNRNEPLQEYVERNYFKLFQELIQTNDHGNFSVTKVCITQKGLFWLSKKYGGEFSEGLPQLALQ